MIQIRNNVFETNSSSTHSVSISNPVTFSKIRSFVEELSFKQEKIGYFIYIDGDDIEFNETFEELLSQGIRKQEILGYLEYFNTDHEQFYETFITPGGEKIVVFGYLGYDG
jgi:hypothetical protein